jgi:hypothetical protein
MWPLDGKVDALFGRFKLTLISRMKRDHRAHPKAAASTPVSSMEGRWKVGRSLPRQTDRQTPPLTLLKGSLNEDADSNMLRSHRAMCTTHKVNKPAAVTTTADDVVITTTDRVNAVDAFVGLVDRAARSLVHTPVDRFVLGGSLADCPHLVLFGPDGGTRDALATRAARLAVLTGGGKRTATTNAYIDLLVPDGHLGQSSDVAWLHEHVVPLATQPCMAPHGRHIIVVRDADRLAQPAQALLCRALEDAGRTGTALIVLTVRSLGAVPGRLRSQCALVRCPMNADGIEGRGADRHAWRAAAGTVRAAGGGSSSSSSSAWRYADFLQDCARKLMRAKGPYTVASCVRSMASEVLRMVEPQTAVRLLLAAFESHFGVPCATLTARMADCSVALTTMTRPVHALEVALLRVWLDRER